MVFVVLSSIFYFKYSPLSVARGKFFIFATIALFGISFLCEQKRQLKQPLVGIFLLLAFLRTFFDNGVRQFESFNFWLSSAAFMYVLSGVLLFWLVYCYTDNIRNIIKPLVAVCVLNFILVIAQLFNFDFMWHHAPAISGFMDTPSQLGQYSALSLPIMFYFHPLLTLIPLTTLFISKSISPILAGALGMGIWGILYIRERKKKGEN